MRPIERWLLDGAVDPGEAARLRWLEREPPAALIEQTLQRVDRARLEELLAEDGEPAPALLELEPPADLVASTLAAVDRERRVEARRSGGRWLRWSAGAGVGLALAASGLIWLNTPTPSPDTSRMVARGSESNATPVVLKMAVGREGTLERARRGGRYDAGDVFYFRYQLSGAGWLHLIRQNGDEVTLLLSQHASAGEDDLRLESGLAAWTSEPGDGASTFALISAPEERPTIAAELQRALEARDDEDSLCGVALSLGWQCDAYDIEVMAADGEAGP